MFEKQKSLFQDHTNIIKMISSGLPANKILSFIVQSMENYFQPLQMHASIMLYDPIQKKLGETISVSLDKSYIYSVQPVEIGPYEGSCGTAAFLKQPVIVTDIENDPLWEKYKHVASKFGLRACWSVPILSPNKELLGTFALYYKTIYSPNTDLIKAIDFYIQLAAIAIEFSKTKENNTMTKILQSYEIEKQLMRKESVNDKLLADLKRALLHSEFEVYYQPYYFLNKDKIAMEALIRWNHPNAGILSPASFLGVAEETGFILEIEQWVLKKAVSEARRLQQKGLQELSLAVNMSALQFEDYRLPDRIAKLLTNLSFDPHNLTLEITERFLIKDNQEVITRLKNLGVRVSIDDFGVSHSSLHYLKVLSVDELKIDQSFIANLDTDFNSYKIVEMIIMLAHQLGLHVVAEGVENQKQYQLLRDMNCDAVQGFLFSKPLPHTELEKTLIHRNEKLATLYI